MPEETLEQKLERIEKALQEKDNTIAELTEKNKGLENKLNSIRLDALTKQVEPAKQVEEEKVVFDFDMQQSIQNNLKKGQDYESY